MNAQSLKMAHPVLSPIHLTGRHMLLAATLVVVTFSMLLCLCILFAYNAPFVFMTHLFAAMNSLPATSVSALTFAITGGIAIILWTVLFLCARQERMTQNNMGVSLAPSFRSASRAPRFSPLPVASTASRQQHTKEPFFFQPATPAMRTPDQRNQAAWEANFTREIEAKQNAIRLRQRSRELRLQTHGFVVSNEEDGYQMKRIGTRNFYKKAQQDDAISKDKSRSREKSAPSSSSDEIYWWSTLPVEQKFSLKSTEGIAKITHRMIQKHTFEAGM